MSGKTQKSSSAIIYQSLSQMSKSFYEKFGDEVLPLIYKAWYAMGLELGKRLKERQVTTDFKSAALAVNNALHKRYGTSLVCEELSKSVYHLKTKSGNVCDVGLENSGRPICEAVMSVNQGRFKAACGIDVDMNIVKSRAIGDNCCEMIYRPLKK